MFLINKYSNWYNNIIQNAQSQQRKRLKPNNLNFIYFEEHHIIPFSIGGSNKKENLVLLTGKEHYICHLLLCKMTTGQNKHKMIRALTRMSFSKSKNQQRYTAKSFSNIKRLMAEMMSEIKTGKKLSIETRKNMSEARKGIIFTESHLKNMSKAQIKRNLKGKNNPFYGKTHTPENIEKFRNQTTRRLFGNIHTKGRKWYTNGKEDRMFLSSDFISPEWQLGRIKNRKITFLNSLQN